MNTGPARAAETQNPAPFPEIPLEIKHIILETAAIIDRTAALRLVLVSKDIQKL